MIVDRFGVAVAGGKKSYCNVNRIRWEASAEGGARLSILAPPLVIPALDLAGERGYGPAAFHPRT